MIRRINREKTEERKLSAELFDALSVHGKETMKQGSEELGKS